VLIAAAFVLSAWWLPSHEWMTEQRTILVVLYGGSIYVANLSTDSECYSVRLPLWLPFLVLVIPTLLLWRRDRRRPHPGFCRRCDYDLTGNTSGRCPECGLEIAKPDALSVAGRQEVP
jgi:hypothetical protein